MNAQISDADGSPYLGPASSGTIASLVAGNIIYPNDTVRRRLQTTAGHGQTYAQVCKRCQKDCHVHPYLDLCPSHASLAAARAARQLRLLPHASPHALGSPPKCSQSNGCSVVPRHGHAGHTSVAAGRGRAAAVSWLLALQPEGGAIGCRSVLHLLHSQEPPLSLQFQYNWKMRERTVRGHTVVGEIARFWNFLSC